MIEKPGRVRQEVLISRRHECITVSSALQGRKVRVWARYPFAFVLYECCRISFDITSSGHAS